GDAGPFELIEWQAQPSRAGIGCECQEQLELAQAHSNGARLDYAAVGHGEPHQWCDHRIAPALTVPRELLTPVEGRAGQVPRRGIHETRELRERLRSHRRKECAELTCERVARSSVRGALALLAPPVEARVCDLMVDPRAETRADLLLES